MIFFAEETTPKTSAPDPETVETDAAPSEDSREETVPAVAAAVQPALFADAHPPTAEECVEEAPAEAPAAGAPPPEAPPQASAPPPEAPPIPARKPLPPVVADVQENRAVIKVIGVGGGGGNAVNRMIEAGVTGVEFIAANTDAQVLDLSLAPVKIQLGVERTGGLGCGGDPEVGRAAAHEDINRLIEALSGADMVFITIGEGGGTGTGAAPVVACVAQEIRALCVAVATKPMGVEGKRRKTTANDGIRELREYVDTLICVPNDRVVEVYGNLKIRDAFRAADDVVRQAVQGISDLIQVPGEINLDFADVRAAMRLRGDAVMGIGIASGEKRVEEATEAAISSPLLEDTSIQGATSIVVNVTGGESLTLNEVQRAVEVVRDAVSPEGTPLYGSRDSDPGDNILVGTALDPALDETGEVSVTVVATGFPDRSRDGVTPHDFAHHFTNRATGTFGGGGDVPRSAPVADEPRTPARSNGRNAAPFERFSGGGDVSASDHERGTVTTSESGHANGPSGSPGSGARAVVDEPISLPEDIGEERWGDLETPPFLNRRK